MNPAGLRTCGGDGAGPGPLPFSVESLLEAERGLGSEPTEPREERPRGAAEPRTWFPLAAPSSSPRKCPAARSQGARGSHQAQGRRTRAGRALSLVTLESNQPLRCGLSAEKEPAPTSPSAPSRAREPCSCFPSHADQASAVPWGGARNPRPRASCLRFSPAEHPFSPVSPHVWLTSASPSPASAVTTQFLRRLRAQSLSSPNGQRSPSLGRRATDLGNRARGYRDAPSPLCLASLTPEALEVSSEGRGHPAATCIRHQPLR